MDSQREHITADKVPSRGLEDLNATPNIACLSASAVSTSASLLRRSEPHTSFSSGGDAHITKATVNPLPTLGEFRVPAPLPRTSAPIVLETIKRKYGTRNQKSIKHNQNNDSDTKLANMIGSAAYYETPAFKRKHMMDEDQVPGRKPTSTEEAAEGDDEDEEMEDAEPGRTKSLIMIFGMTTVRRASTNDKSHQRTKRYNRRAKFLRRVSGEQSLYGWD